MGTGENADLPWVGSMIENYIYELALHFTLAG